MSDTVLVEREGAISFITLNRPAEGNAIDVALARALLEAVNAVEADQNIRCVVVRGNGRMFCVGGDAKALYAAGGDLGRLLNDILVYLHPAISRLASMSKPVITAVHGPSAGAGLGLAVVGDIVLAEPAAHFTMAYSKIGLSPDAGATWLLPRLVGLRRAQELSLTSRRVTAEEAAAIGLITRVVSSGSLTREVDAIAEDLADAAIGALGRTKRLLRASAEVSLDQQLQVERDNIVQQGDTSEGRLGVAAFVERRGSKT
jgi:2-(1,2-epoxy-1,2-dihydrophenyl)acetyl-CoA isomerase